MKKERDSHCITSVPCVLHRTALTVGSNELEEDDFWSRTIKSAGRLLFFSGAGNI